MVRPRPFISLPASQPREFSIGTRLGQTHIPRTDAEEWCYTVQSCLTIPRKAVSFGSTEGQCQKHHDRGAVPLGTAHQETYLSRLEVHHIFNCCRLCGPGPDKINDHTPRNSHSASIQCDVGRDGQQRSHQYRSHATSGLFPPALKTYNLLIFFYHHLRIS